MPYFEAEHIEICVNCLLFLANGDEPEDAWGWSADQLDQNWPPEEGWQIHPAHNTEGSFSYVRCGACGSSLGGDRHLAVAMRRVQSELEQLAELKSEEGQ